VSSKATFFVVTIALALSSHAMAGPPKQLVDIAAGDLATALLQLSDRYGADLVYRPDQVQGLKTRGAHGRFTNEEAANQLLQGTGLKLSTGASGSMLIAAPQAAAAAPSQESTPDRESKGGKIESSHPFRMAQAAQGASAGAATVAGQPMSTTTQLEEITVTAQKREERLQNVPISIAVLSGRDLDNSSFQGVTEALNSVPGVTTFPWSQGGGTMLAVRGVIASGALFTGSSPIAFYLDGVPFGLVDTALVPDANAYDLQQVEVLRGPQGTLYGANALNGVVRILTNNADLSNFDIKASASDSYTEGGGNNYRGDMALNVPILQGRLAARAVLGYDNLSGWLDKPNANEANANDAIVRNLRLKLNAEPIDNLTVGLSGWLSRQAYGAPNVSNPQGFSTRSLPESVSTDYGAYGLSIGYKFSALSITSTTSYLNYASTDITDFADLVGFDVPLDENFHAHVLSEEINLTSNLSGPWHWTAGLFYRDAANSTLQVLPAIVTLDWTDTSRSYAAFAELSRRFWGDRLEWTLGGRYFHDNVGTREDRAVAPLSGPGYYRADSSFSRPTPRAVLTWHLTQNGMAYTSFSEGFRSGARQPYYAVAGDIDFPPVKPDKLYNYEIGTKDTFFEQRLELDAALYYMDWKDLQQTLSVPFGQTFVDALVNGGAASGLGVDLGITARPSDSLELSANFSWNDLTWNQDLLSAGAVVFHKGGRLNYSAKETASVSGAYVIPIGAKGWQGRLFGSANYSSPLDAVTAVGNGTSLQTKAGNSLFTVRAGVSLRSPNHWTVSLFADNLNNWRGALLQNPAYAINAETRLRPRTVGLQFEYQ